MGARWSKRDVSSARLEWGVRIAEAVGIASRAGTLCETRLCGIILNLKAERTLGIIRSNMTMVTIE